MIPRYVPIALCAVLLAACRFDGPVALELERNGINPANSVIKTEGHSETIIEPGQPMYFARVKFKEQRQQISHERNVQVISGTASQDKQGAIRLSGKICGVVIPGGLDVGLLHTVRYDSDLGVFLMLQGRRWTEVWFEYDPRYFEAVYVPGGQVLLDEVSIAPAPLSQHLIVDYSCQPRLEGGGGGGKRREP